MKTDQELSEFRTWVRDQAVDDDRIKSLELMFNEMARNVEDGRRGRSSRKRSLFLIGDSSSGKSFALEKLFARHPAFQTKEGRSRPPFVSVEVKLGGIVALCNSVARELGMPENYKMKPAFAFQFLMDMLRDNEIDFLHIDEAQDLMRSITTAEVQKMQVMLKDLVQTDEWPLHTIYSGVGSLAAVLGTDDKQLKNRGYVHRFANMVFPKDQPVVEKILRTVAHKHCKLELDDEIVTPEFFGRIHVASGAAFGEAIEIVQGASFMALNNGHTSLRAAHFKRFYRFDSGCLPQDNVFEAPTWKDINPRNALADLTNKVKKAKSRK